MSARPHRTGRRAGITVAAGVLMAGVVSGIAAADSPALDRGPCSMAIAAAGVWPGTYDTAHHQHRLVSDAYDGYLARRPECSPDLASR